MENVEYVFVDPGTTHLGIVLMKFKDNEVIVRKETLQVTMDLASVDNALSPICKSCSDDLIMFFEDNHFMNSPDLTKKLSVVCAYVECFFVNLNKWNIAGMRTYHMLSSHISRKYNLNQLGRNKKKEVMKNAFLQTFGLTSCTDHEADAFAAGAAIVKWKPGQFDYSKDFDKKLKDLTEIFYDYVRFSLNSYTPNHPK